MNEEELKQRELEQEEFQQMLKSSNQPKVPGGDGKKLYQVGCYTADDWQHIHEVLLEDGTLEGIHVGIDDGLQDGCLVC